MPKNDKGTHQDQIAHAQQGQNQTPSEKSQVYITT